MGMFKDMLKSNESIFRDSIPLDYDYQPKRITSREKEQQQIVFSIKPLLQKRNGRNLIITGKPGLGKTVVCRHILSDIEDETDEIIPIYINCWKKNTSYKIANEICNLIGYKFTQNKRTDELLNVIIKELNKESVVFVFDEIDKVEDFDFMYSFLEEIYRKTFILITNYKEWIINLDERIKSRLTPETMEFTQYNASQIKDILSERKKYAFVEGVWDENAFDKIIEETTELGDVRKGLFFMRESGNTAEDKSSKNITTEHVEEALKKIQEFSVANKEELDPENKFILDVIKDNSGKKIGELFKTYEEKGGKGNYKAFQRRIKKLEDNKFITTEKISGGAEGKTTIINFQQKTLSDF
ncbi:AAA family ATPase [Candidatus Woesearchaeota archaeon]|nr:AAA family ATPase [Candidatus Woesearchaeota archaeon]